MFKLKFAITEQDYEAWIRIYRRKNIKQHRIFSFNLILIISSFSSLILINIMQFPRDLMVIFLIVLLCFLLGILLTMLINERTIISAKKRITKNYPDFYEEREYTFSDTDFQAKGKEIDTKYKYSLFSEVLEDENCYYLYLKNKMGIILPKKYFTTEQIEFIKEKVKQS